MGDPAEADLDLLVAIVAGDALAVVILDRGLGPTAPLRRRRRLGQAHADHAEAHRRLLVEVDLHAILVGGHGPRRPVGLLERAAVATHAHVVTIIVTHGHIVVVGACRRTAGPTALALAPDGRERGKQLLVLLRLPVMLRLPHARDEAWSGLGVGLGMGGGLGLEPEQLHRPWRRATSRPAARR